MVTIVHITIIQRIVHAYDNTVHNIENIFSHARMYVYDFKVVLFTYYYYGCILQFFQKFMQICNFSLVYFVVNLLHGTLILVTIIYSSNYKLVILHLAMYSEQLIP